MNRNYYQRKQEGKFRLAALALLGLWCAVCALPATAQTGTVPTGDMRAEVTAFPDEQPVAGAEARLTRSNQNLHFKTETNDNGVFEFENIPVGEWWLRVAKPGFHPIHMLIVIDDTQRLELKLVLEPISTPGGAIVGRVTDALSGVPLANALVYLPFPGDVHIQVVNGPEPNAWLWALTDDDGYYRIEAAPPGEYAIVARAHGYMTAEKRVEVSGGVAVECNFELTPVPSTQTGAVAGKVIDRATSEPLEGAYVSVEGIFTFAPILTDENGEYHVDGVPVGERRVHVGKEGYHPEEKSVPIIAGETAIANFALEPRANVEPGAIEGQVLDAETQAPIAGAKVFYAPHHADHPPRWADDPAHELIQIPHVETDENGNYRIGELRPGHWVLVAWSEGYRRARQVAPVEPGEATVANFELQPISTATGQIEGQLYNAVTDQVISDGYVFHAPLPPFFDPESNAGKSNPSHGLMEIAGPDSGAPFVRTDDNGHYIIPQLPPGAYILVAWAPDHLPKAEIAQVTSGETTVVNFPLESTLPVDPAVVEGRVTDAETGDPIAGAELRFRQVPAPGLQVDDDDDENHGLKSNSHTTVLTGDNGQYRVELRPGAYRVRVKAEGYHPARTGIVLASGDAVELNFELKPENPPQPGAIAGIVTDESTGEPIAGAWVFYGPRFGDNLPLEWYLDDNHPRVEHDAVSPVGSHGHYVRTGNTGEYLIENLKPGDWYLKVKAEGYLPQRRKVEVESGETTFADFALAPDTVQPGAIAGMVMDGLTSEPLAGAKVYYQRLRPDLTEHDPRVNTELNPAIAPVLEPPFVITDADGMYEIPQLRPGRYRMLAKLEGYHAAGKVAVVEEGETTRVNFRLRPRDNGTGTVFGVVRDAATSEPLAMAKVWIVPAGEVVITDISPLVILGEAETNNAGEYEIEDVPEGPVKVIAAKEGYRQAARRLLVLTGERHEVNFRLQPIPTRPRGHLKGTVIDEETGDPLAHALIVVIPRDGDDTTTGVRIAGRIGDAGSFELSRHPGRPRVTLTDRNGQYVVRHLPAGFYTVKAAKRGYFKARQGVRILPGEVTTADFALAPKPRPEFGSLGGQVRDAATGEPIAHAWVRYLPDESELLTNVRGLRTRTDENGRYGFGHVPVGEGVVWAARRGYEPQRREVRIHADQRTIANFALEPIATTGTLTGVVTDLLSEEPIEGALVFVPLIALPHTANADNALFGETDAEGRYTIEGVPTGRRLVVADHPDYIADAQVADVVASGTTELDFALFPWPEGDGELEIEVVSAATGEPLGGVALRLPFSEWFEPDGEFDRNTIRTNAAGRATFRRLPHGQWSLVAALRGYAPAFQSVTVEGHSAAGGRSDDAKGAAGSEASTVLRIELDTAEGNAADDWVRYE